MLTPLHLAASPRSIAGVAMNGGCGADAKSKRLGERPGKGKWAADRMLGEFEFPRCLEKGLAKTHV
jgi:hypothetical protein